MKRFGRKPRSRALTPEAISASRQFNCSVVMLGNGEFSMIDKEDEALVSLYTWSKHTGGYASSGVGAPPNRRVVYLHRLVMNVPETMEVDHRHGNKLDNRKSELRICTNIQQRGNSKKTTRLDASSKFKGVRKSFNRWECRGKENYKHVALGRFDSEIEAAKAYNTWALARWGEFARLNVIP